LGSSSWLIDVGPDFRQQAMKFGIHKIDGLLLTHTHYDHVAGIDDLRIFSVRQKKPIPCLLSSASHEALQVRYAYLFQQGVSMTAQIDCQVLEEERGEVDFLGHRVGYCHYSQGGMKVTGFRIGNFAYISDIHDYEPSVFDSLKGVKALVLSALRQAPTHLQLSVEEAVEFARKVGAEHTRLTHLSHFLEHEKVNAKLPKDVQLGYDGLTMEFEVENWKQVKED